MTDASGDDGDFDSNTRLRLRLHRVCYLDNGLAAERGASWLAATSQVATSRDHLDYIVVDSLDMVVVDIGLGRAVVVDIGRDIRGFRGA